VDSRVFEVCEPKFMCGIKITCEGTVSAITGTSGRLHSEFVRLLFVQAHRETDRFFAASGVQLAQHDRGCINRFYL
jgi:hypothetical protein